MYDTLSGLASAGLNLLAACMLLVCTFGCQANTHLQVEKFLRELPANARVIEVPMERLVAGDMRYNVVIRPDDTVVLLTTEQRKSLVDTCFVSSEQADLPTGHVMVDEHRLIESRSIRRGERVIVSIYELYEPGVDAVYQKVVDDAGVLTIGRLGNVYVLGLTDRGLESQLRERLEASGILRNATVRVILEPGANWQYTLISPDSGRKVIDFITHETRLVQVVVAAELPEVSTIETALVVRP